MSEKPTMIPLLEGNEAPTPAVRRKKTGNKTSSILIALVIVLLVILVLVLVAALILALSKKCDIKGSDEKKPDKVPEVVRKNNSYWNRKELPGFANTNKYIITLQLMKEAFSLKEHYSTNYFFGRVTFNVTISSNTNFIVLSGKGVRINWISTSYVYFHDDQRHPKIKEMIYDDVFEQIILVFDKTMLKEMVYHVQIEYRGNITLADSGVIQTFYRDMLNNKTYSIQYSKLEPNGARRMFPCFDEPDRKALFEMQIFHLAKYRVLSNMPLSNESLLDRDWLIVNDTSVSPNSSMKLSKFEPTVIPMSTYLVAFVLVEDYENLTKFRKENHLVSVWGPRGFQESGNVALNWSIATENFFEDYFNFSSPLPKSDHIYIPNFLPGAMENWGLMTYRKIRLLMSPRKGELSAKGAYKTIAHEIAHIWFGNWITMKTWTDLWLNEAFASYFATVAFDKQSKMSDLKISELNLANHRSILEKDGTSIFNPIRMKKVNFMNLFNRVTYSKGEALLVWLNSLMGEERFRAAFQAYLRKYSRRNPTTKEFFAEMEVQMIRKEDFNISLYDYFEPWLDKVGYPVVTVAEDPQRGEIILTQQSVANISQNQTWPIHTTYKIERSDTAFQLFFKNKVHRTSVNISNGAFIVLNADGKGYLRVNYSSALWTRLIEGIRAQSPGIKQINKIVLLDDSIYFADNNLINVSITKALIDTLVNETSLITWQAFINTVFNKMFNFFADDKVYIKWSAYVKKLSKKVRDAAIKIDMYGNLDMYDEAFQKFAFKMGGRIDNQKVLEILSKRFESWILTSETAPLPKHLISTILYYGIKTKDNQINWMKMWNMFVSKTPSKLIDKDQLAIGLTGTSKPYLLNKLLDHLLIPNVYSSDLDKSAISRDVVGGILESSNGINILRRWIVNNQKRIKKYAFGDNVPEDTAQTNLDTLLTSIASTTYDPNAIRPLLTLHSNKLVLTKIVMANNHWRENVGKRLLQYL